ncbi:MAG: hypothetical protein M1823_000662 [Watsoniomyces obsoletus]|nr:MAG: hypothetical protein M1823_000662 [Watsoniomyces obsoletus]
MRFVFVLSAICASVALPALALPQAVAPVPTAPVPAPVAVPETPPEQAARVTNELAAADAAFTRDRTEVQRINDLTDTALQSQLRMPAVRALQATIEQQRQARHAYVDSPNIPVELKRSVLLKLQFQANWDLEAANRQLQMAQLRSQQRPGDLSVAGEVGAAQDSLAKAQAEKQSVDSKLATYGLLPKPVAK